MDKNNLDRRDFFRKAGQLTFLSAMLGGLAYLIAEDRVQLEGCTENQFCEKCQKLTSCTLEPAKKFKQDER
jgi:hypothetical protein